jgi:hypothetical protein
MGYVAHHDRGGGRYGPGVKAFSHQISAVGQERRADR